MNGDIGRRTPQRMVHLSETHRSLPNLASNGHGSAVNAMGYTRTPDKLQRNRDFTCMGSDTRKERARRNLVDTLSSKRPLVTHKRGGNLSSREQKLSPEGSVARRDITGLHFDHGVNRVSTTGTSGVCDDGFDSEIREIQGGGLSGFSRSSLHKSDSSLPQLIHDLNSTLKYSRRHHREESLSSDDDVVYTGDDLMQVLSQNWSRKNKADKHKQWLRYRPITPNLLERLDKLKMSSRARTEQWLKQIPSEKRSYHSPLYRLGNVSKEGAEASSTPNESWIYEERGKSAHGARKSHKMD